ncbi:MAG: efflux RND transporter periplasmic adaptor subunit [Arcobacteraceae bacterium]|jgi:macrolide-specific efflux system membrane fusion protein|nr:efflux RND transporter periplasmic adaptor subunit [Arcobacteraceae bacterium]
MKKSVIIVGIVFLSFVGGYFVYKSYFGTNSSIQNNIKIKVTKGDIEDVVTATGTLQPRDYVDVGAQVSGQLQNLYVNIGDEVKQGQLLAEINATVLQAKVDASKAQLKQQKAQLKDEEAQLELANINYKRQKNLFDGDATTLESLQNSEQSLKSADAQLEMLKAQIEQTQSNLRSDEANLAYAKIYAPMDGTIVSISAKQGQTLNANQQAPVILRIADLSIMTVQTEVSEAEILKLKPNMNVYFKTMGSDKKWFAKVDKIEPTPTVTNNVVLYNALFNINNESKELMTYMTAQVFFVVNASKDTLIVPLSVLVFDNNIKKQENTPKEFNKKNRPDFSQMTQEEREQRKQERALQREQNKLNNAKNAMVRVVGEDGVIREQEVKIGVTNRIQAEIISGINENDILVMSSTKQDNSVSNKVNNTQKQQQSNSMMPPPGI